MKYLEFVNELIRKEILPRKDLVVFGQNISAGSCLGGLTKGISAKGNCRIINTPNCENTLCGFGFGLMMNGASGIFFMKQLDFLLLGIDQLVNTYNIIRNTLDKDLMGSFTIVPIIVDDGYQGAQSSLNNFADFCSIARIAGFTITNKLDAERIIAQKLISPGFRIIGVSQRLFKKEIITPEKLIYSDSDSAFFQYKNGKDVTVVCFNFSFPQGWELCRELERRRIQPSFFNVNALTPISWDAILKNIKVTKKLIIIDDSKSANLACDNLVSNIDNKCHLKKKIILKRELSDDWLNPVSDEMKIDYIKVSEELA